ncbi:hypothetical protein [Zunongwangia sp. HRR-M8]|uniref:hypothetical protein n=1 Tax=Zunongwangia sp. HRR-M8 TaxID=3015170 RepID=UPI0022DD49CE|nr:hypothetical protein [Zunongwangia sp. HRR-M8]WBL23801.1 hypothetical protein PBT89_07525 [Zunongwangia sp. HRR-M8]
MYVQIDGLGSIPYTLIKSQYKFSNGYSNPPIVPLSKIIRTFDEFDSFLERTHTRFGMEYIKRDLPVGFDKKSSAEYRRRMRTEKSTKCYIDETIRDLENQINMDW